jgi:hypothetical protein
MAAAGAFHIRPARVSPGACAPLPAHYARDMSELLEAAANIALIMLLLGLLAALGSRLFGPQVLGLPAMLGAFAFIALLSTSTEVGAIGLLTAVLGVLAVFIIIGLAMTYGDDLRDLRRRRDG